MNLLDAIGSLFVYRSPEPLDGLRSNLRYLSNKKLQVLAETKTHYSKSILINMIIDEIKDRDKN
mgnify:CR=1 FL=1|tara:strand:- start:278 stop:469 length:192 start_codon:yes stop_codon:yes gene_type:complete